MTTPRPSRTAAVALVIAAAVATGTMSALGPATATAAPTCADVHVVSARGTNEPGGTDWNVHTRYARHADAAADFLTARI
jgi:hypothetical protein